MLSLTVFEILDFGPSGVIFLACPYATRAACTTPRGHACRSRRKVLRDGKHSAFEADDNPFSGMLRKYNLNMAKAVIPTSEEPLFEETLQAWREVQYRTLQRKGVGALSMAAKFTPEPHHKTGGSVLGSFCTTSRICH